MSWLKLVFRIVSNLLNVKNKVRWGGVFLCLDSFVKKVLMVFGLGKKLD